MKNYTVKLGFIALAGCLVMVSACKHKPPGYPIIPALEYKAMVRNNDGSATFKFSFKDGDADIGNTVDMGSNFFMNLFVKNGTQWVDTNITLDYVVPVMDGGGKYTPYEGEIHVTVPAPFGMAPVSKFECWVVDRAGHQSNIVTTDEFVP